MVYNDTSTKAGILQECEFLVFGADYGAITGNAVRLDEFTRLCNRGLDRVVSVLMDSDSRWQWDDSNYTDFPEATTSLVDNQQDYTIETTHLQIIGVEVKDSSGNYYNVHPIDHQDLKERDITPSEFFETAGTPEYYDLKGSSIILYPKPDASTVTLAEGLKAHFKRGANYFTNSDTTTEPGFPSIYHRLIPLYASYDYAIAHEMTNKANTLLGEIEREKENLRDFMGKRNRDEKPFISMKIKQSK